MTHVQFTQALEACEQLLAQGIPLTFGQYLVERGLLEPTQLRELLGAQGRRQLVCSNRQCATRFTLIGFLDSRRYACSKCAATLIDIRDAEPIVKYGIELGGDTIEESEPPVERQDQPGPTSTRFQVADGGLGQSDRALMMAALRSSPQLILRLASTRGVLRLTPQMHLQLNRHLRPGLTVTSAIRTLNAVGIVGSDQIDALLCLEREMIEAIDLLGQSGRGARDHPLTWTAIELGLLDHETLLKLLIEAHREQPAKRLDEALLASDVMDQDQLARVLDEVPTADITQPGEGAPPRVGGQAVARTTDPHTAGLSDTVLRSLNLQSGSWVDKYRIERRLGRGGMACVYLARANGVPHAFKVLLPSMAQQEEYLRRFDREAHFTRQLMHRGIVKLTDSGLVNGTPYIVMEFIDGPTLAESVRGRLPLSVAEVLRVLEQLAEAIAYAHGKGILHRDIKPENVLQTQQGNLKLADFGLIKEVGRLRASQQIALTSEHLCRVEAEFRNQMIEVLEKPGKLALLQRLETLKAIIAEAQDSAPIDFELSSMDRFESMGSPNAFNVSMGLTITGECLGTPHYMSPEQFAGRLTDGRTDIFSLGVMAYYFLTGSYPWGGRSLMELGQDKLEREAMPIRELRPDLPDGLARLVDKMIRRFPEDRYPTAEFLRCDLQRIRNGQGPLLEAPGWLEVAIEERSREVHHAGRHESYEIIVGLLLEFLEIARVTESPIN